jgi:UTP--glucose-1-phosphate uridylyltransferase
MIRNIVLQAKQLGLGHAVLCAERAVSGDPFAVLLADNFLTDCEPVVTTDLINAYAKTGKSQLSVMEVDEPDISKYGVVVPNGSSPKILGLIEKPDINDAPSNLASIGRYVLTNDIFRILSGLSAGSGEEIQLADAINIHAQWGLVETVRFNGKRYDCGSVDGYMQAPLQEYHRRSVT